MRYSGRLSKTPTFWSRLTTDGYPDSTGLYLTILDPLLTIISDGRFVDTSATGRYSAQTEGWNVQKRSGGTEIRKCVTTRNDGAIDITIEPNPYGTGYLSVNIA